MVKYCKGVFAMTKRYTSEEKELINDLVSKGFTNRQIAEEVGRTYSAIAGYIKKYKVRANFKGVSRTCKNCNTEFIATHNLHQREFCSDNCRTRYFENHSKKHKIQCRNCLNYFYSGRKNMEYCSVECREDWNEKHRVKPVVSYVVYRFNCKFCKKRCNGVGRRSRKYCSRNCEDKYRYRRDQAKKILINTRSIKCRECGKHFSTHIKDRKYCSKTCSNRYQWRKAYTLRRTRIKENGKIDHCISLEKLYKRDKGICHICTEKVNMNLNTNDNMYGSIDHVIPLAKGGTHTWDNIKLAHRICNSIKGAEVYEAPAPFMPAGVFFKS